MSTNPNTIEITLVQKCGKASSPDVRVFLEPVAHEKEACVRLGVSSTNEKNVLVHTNEEPGIWRVVEDRWLDILRMFQPTLARVKHRGLTKIMDLEQTLKMLQWRRKMTKQLLASADQEDKDIHEDEDTNTIVDEHDFYDEIRMSVCRIVQTGFEKECNRLWSIANLEGKECPVLLTPLEPGKTALLHCRHLVSLEAWEKIMSTTELCPLCRKCTLVHIVI
jgi:hypothetical protein